MTEKDIQREEEFDLVKGLLEAAEYRTSEDCISEEEIRRGGKLLIRVHIHPISDNDFKTARKKATTFMPNPMNKKLPQIEKSFDTALYNSWIIYLATTPDDQRTFGATRRCATAGRQPAGGDHRRRADSR